MEGNITEAATRSPSPNNSVVCLVAAMSLVKTMAGPCSYPCLELLNTQVRLFSSETCTKTFPHFDNFGNNYLTPISR